MIINEIKDVYTWDSPGGCGREDFLEWAMPRSRSKICWKAWQMSRRTVSAKRKAHGTAQQQERTWYFWETEEFIEHSVWWVEQWEMRGTGTSLWRALLRTLASILWAVGSHQRHLVWPFNSAPYQLCGCGHVRGHRVARSFQGQSQDGDVSPLSGRLAPGWRCGEQGEVAQDPVDGARTK